MARRELAGSRACRKIAPGLRPRCGGYGPTLCLGSERRVGIRQRLHYQGVQRRIVTPDPLLDSRPIDHDASLMKEFVWVGAVVNTHAGAAARECQ